MPDQFQIFIDKEKFTPTEETVTGAILRALPNPDVPEDRDLYKEVPGGEDELIDAGPLRRNRRTSVLQSTRMK